jgi:hypothetical protein
MNDDLTRWETAALVTVGAASAYNVLLWSLGYGIEASTPGMTPLGVLRVIFAVVSFVGLDLIVVVTVMAMRAGRRGIWSEAAAGSAALAAGLIALEVAGVVTWPWLHAAPAVVLYTFMRHVAALRNGGMTTVDNHVAEDATELDTAGEEARPIDTEIDTAPAPPRLEDLAQQHQVSTRTIRRWLATGKISP